MPGKANVEAAPPVGRSDFIDTAGGTGDPRIVDQGVKPAELAGNDFKHLVDIAVDRDLGLAGDGSRQVAPGLFDCCIGDIADGHPGSQCAQCAGDGKAYPRGARSDQHTLIGDPFDEVCC